MASKEPEQLHCPDCGTPVVLLPLKLYTGTEDLDPAEVPDVVPHSWGSMFAIVDEDRSYTCPKCRRPQRLER
jgi:predicted RNA-binding Zn-ribbon protein involved in translation (DUF1610 family)